MLSINQLMKYLRNHHHITVKSNQAQALRNVGYYHGYPSLTVEKVKSARKPLFKV